MSLAYYTGQTTLADLIWSQLRQGIKLAELPEHLRSYLADNHCITIPKLPEVWNVRLERRPDREWRVWIEAPGLKPRNAREFRYLTGFVPHVRPGGTSPWYDDLVDDGADQKATPSKKKPNKKPKKKGAGGAREGKYWTPLVAHLRTKFPGKSYPESIVSFRAAKDWMDANNKSAADSTIRNGLRRHFPQWPRH